jgi:hypothetical protein
MELNELAHVSKEWSVTHDYGERSRPGALPTFWIGGSLLREFALFNVHNAKLVRTTARALGASASNDIPLAAGRATSFV